MTKAQKSWINKGNCLFVGFFGFLASVFIYQVITFPPFRNPERLPSPVISYEFETWPISINHPKSWFVNEYYRGEYDNLEVIGTITPSTGLYPYVTIFYKELDNQPTIETAVEWGMGRRKPCIRFEPGEQIPHDSPGQSGAISNYVCVRNVNFGSFISKEMTIKCSDYYILKGKSAYDLNLCSEKDNWSKVEKVFDETIQSFEIN